MGSPRGAYLFLVLLCSAAAGQAQPPLVTLSTSQDSSGRYVVTLENTRDVAVCAYVVRPMYYHRAKSFRGEWGGFSFDCLSSPPPPMRQRMIPPHGQRTQNIGMPFPGTELREFLYGVIFEDGMADGDPWITRMILAARAFRIQEARKAQDLLARARDGSWTREQLDMAIENLRKSQEGPSDVPAERAFRSAVGMYLLTNLRNLRSPNGQLLPLTEFIPRFIDDLKRWEEALRAQHGSNR
jgi:hypothetical protein